MCGAITKDTHFQVMEQHLAVENSEAPQRGGYLPDITPMGMRDMLLKHSKLVKIIVAKMRDSLPSYADLEELESVGVIGLINAIERFDVSKGYTFETYASIRIKGAILDELRSYDMVPRSVRTKQRKLQKSKERLEQTLGREPTDEEIQRDLGLESKAYEKFKSQTRPISLIYLDKASQSDETNPHEAISDDTQVLCSELLEQKELKELVARKILELPEAQKKVLALYFFEEMRLAEIGHVMGLTEARVSQIRTQAINTLRTFVRRMTY
jgi:RNA polymerase sigma factor for flagellar operon FliA